MPKSLICSVLAAASLCLISKTASAQEMRIPYRGLDFGRPADLAAFQAQVERAVTLFCYKPEAFEGDAGLPNHCRADVWDQVMSQLPADRRQALEDALQARPRMQPTLARR